MTPDSGILARRGLGHEEGPIRALLAEISQALFLGNPAGTVAIMQEKVVAFGVRTRQGFDMRRRRPASTTAWCRRTS